MSVVVAVAYWRDGGVYPRARGTRGDVYLQGTATMAATWCQVSSVDDVEFVLCTNVEPDGQVGEQLDRLGVRTWSVPFTSRPPEGYFHKFSASTYSLDVLRAFADRLGDDDVLVLVDPDVVWLRDPAPVVARVRRSGLLVYTLPYPPDQRDLGTTRRQLTSLVAEMSDVPADGLVEHVGGELVAVTGSHLREYVASCDRAWTASLERFHDGRSPRLNTEEHVFAYAFHALGYSPAEHTTSAIRRIWTRPARLRNVRPDDLERSAWHVLTEKGRGLADLFADLDAGRGIFAEGVDEATRLRLLARQLAVDPSPWTRVRLRAGMVWARAMRRRIGAMPA